MQLPGFSLMLYVYMHCLRRVWACINLIVLFSCQCFSLSIRSKIPPLEPLQFQCAAPQAPVCLCEAPACTVSQAPNARSPLLPKSFRKTNRGGGRKKVGRQREAEGKKGAVQSRPWSHFFPFITPPPFSPTPPSFFVHLTLPLLPLPLSLALVLTEEWGLMSVQRWARQLVNIPKGNISNRSCDQPRAFTYTHSPSARPRQDGTRHSGGEKVW